MQTNTTNLNGNYNIVIQSSTLENCTISTIFDEEAFFDFIQTIFQKETMPLTVIVLTLTKARASLIENRKNEAARYGKTYKEWQIFRNENVLKLFFDFQENTGFKTNVIFLDCKENTIDDIFRLKLKLFRTRAIFVVDGIALDEKFPANRKLAKLFDAPETGGVLAPLCRQLPYEHKLLVNKNIANVFTDLKFYSSNIEKFMYSHANMDFSQVEFEIGDKNHFLKKLIYFANTYFPNKGQKIQRVVVKWNKEFSKFHNISDKTSHLEQ